MSLERRALPEVIETERLRLRGWEASDAEDVFDYARDPEWSKFLRILPVPYAFADAEQFIVRQSRLDRVVHPGWAIDLDGSVIGGINLRFSFDHLLAEMGYSVARAHWNRGFCTEAASAVVDAAFGTHPDLNRVRAMADVMNTASQRVLEKVGMRKEGVLRQNRIERGHAIDEAWFGILRGEWEEGRRSDERRLSG